MKIGFFQIRLFLSNSSEDNPSLLWKQSAYDHAQQHQAAPSKNFTVTPSPLKIAAKITVMIGESTKL